MKTKHWLAGVAFAAAAIGLPFGEAAQAQDKTVGVSWRHFQEERWKIDEAGIKSVLEAEGFTYVGADAQADPQKQLQGALDVLAARRPGARVIAIPEGPYVLAGRRCG